MNGQLTLTNREAIHIVNRVDALDEPRALTTEDDKCQVAITSSSAKLTVSLRVVHSQSPLLAGPPKLSGLGHDHQAW